MAQGAGDDELGGASRESSSTQSTGGVLPDELGLDGGEALEKVTERQGRSGSCVELGVASLRRYGVIRFTRDLIAT